MCVFVTKWAKNCCLFVQLLLFRWTIEFHDRYK